MDEDALDSAGSPRGWILALRVLCVLGILALGWSYGSMASAYGRSPTACYEEPGRCDQEVVVFSVWEVVALGPGEYQLFKSGGPFRVRGESVALKVGDKVSVTGRFDAGTEAVLEQSVEIHRLRGVKEAFSMAGALCALVLILRGLRIRGGRLVIRG